MAKIYWRRIKAGTRFYHDVPSVELKGEIRILAAQDVANGVITEDQFKTLIGEDYQT